jgi:hypothetical protein
VAERNVGGACRHPAAGLEIDKADPAGLDQQAVDGAGDDPPVGEGRGDRRLGQRAGREQVAVGGIADQRAGEAGDLLAQRGSAAAWRRSGSTPGRRSNSR